MEVARLQPLLPQAGTMRERRAIRILPGASGKRPVDGVHLRSIPAIESHWMTTFDLRWLEHLRNERQSSGADGRKLASTPASLLRS